tara:strand:- start:53 stop:1414 length:1362 start_codon:yes stop_codon:yes gene_type:complete
MEQSVLLQQINKQMFGGLLNIGNTCYLNTALQCLFNVKDLNKYMLFNKDFKEELIDDCIERPFTETYYETLQLLLSNDKINPLPLIRVFFNLCSKKGIDCALGRQEDSQEFLLYMIDNIHESLKYRVNIKCNIPGDTELDKQICKSHEQWLQCVKDDYSIIVNLFYGQFMYNISKKEEPDVIISNTFEKFNSISLPVTDKTKTLYDCLDSYIHTEFSGDEKYFYEKEDKKIDAFRTCFIWKLPKYMILSFKRFNYDGTKNNQKIDFVIDSLDMSGYTHVKNSYKVKYDLISIGCHIGDSNGGHYYAITRKSQNIWVLYNDANLSKITDINKAIKSILSDVYILIYKNRNDTTDIISDDEFEKKNISDERFKDFNDVNSTKYISSDISLPFHELYKDSTTLFDLIEYSDMLNDSDIEDDDDYLHYIEENDFNITSDYDSDSESESESDSKCNEI